MVGSSLNHGMYFSAICTSLQCGVNVLYWLYSSDANIRVGAKQYALRYLLLFKVSGWTIPEVKVWLF